MIVSSPVDPPAPALPSRSRRCTRAARAASTVRMMTAARIRPSLRRNRGSYSRFRDPIERQDPPLVLRLALHGHPVLERHVVLAQAVEERQGPASAPAGIPPQRPGGPAAARSSRSRSPPVMRSVSYRPWQKKGTASAVESEPYLPHGRPAEAGEGQAVADEPAGEHMQQRHRAQETHDDHRVADDERVHDVFHRGEPQAPGALADMTRFRRHDDRRASGTFSTATSANAPTFSIIGRAQESRRHGYFRTRGTLRDDRAYPGSMRRASTAP